jgi:hypothetical protein
MDKTNKQHSYTIKTSQNETLMFSKKTLGKDLGIILSSNMNWKNQAMYCANKMFKQTFEYFDLDMVKTIYTTFCCLQHV